MPHQKRTFLLTVLISLAILVLAAACSPAPAAPPAQPAEPPATVVAALPTGTPSPTATLEPTATASVTPVPPTDTPQPSPTPALALLPDGISGYCLPVGSMISLASDPLAPPETAQIGAMAEDGSFDLRNMPWAACSIAYTFNQPAPAGLTLEVYDLNQKKSWLQIPLTPVEGKAEVVSALLRHSYIIEPPFWNISYEFAVKDAAGQELTRTTFNLHRWETGLCWQGTYPDIDTLYCPLQQDLHPWDPGYGQILPTVTPDGD